MRTPRGLNLSARVRRASFVPTLHHLVFGGGRFFFKMRCSNVGNGLQPTSPVNKYWACCCAFWGVYSLKSQETFNSA